MTHSIKNYILSIILAGVLVCYSGKLFSNNTTGAGELSKTPLGARPVALGEAFVGIADDSSAFYYNPAGLANLSWSYLSIHTQKNPFNRYSGALSFIHSPGEDGSWAFGVSTRFMAFPGIKLYDSTGSNTGTSMPNSGIGYVSIAKRFGKIDSFSIGLNGKFIMDKMVSENGLGGGIDLALKSNINLFGKLFLVAGAMLQDAFTVEKFDSRGKLTYFDRVLKIGLSIQSPAFVISFQIDKNLSISDKAVFRIGTYLKLWQGKGKVDFGFNKIQDLEKQDLSQVTKPKKEFQDELFFNIGYGGGFIGAGFTLKIARIKFDLTGSFSELNWNNTNLLFTVEIPLY